MEKVQGSIFFWIGPERMVQAEENAVKHSRKSIAV